MRFKFNEMMCAMSLAAALPAFAEAPKQIISMDKGTLRLRFVDGLAKKFVSEVNRGPHCAAEVSVQEANQRIQIRHQGGECASGAIVTLTLPSGKSFEITHGGGVIEVDSVNAVIRKFASIHAHVDGGVVQTESSQLQLGQGYAPATASYENPGNSKGPSLEITLEGGVIQFRK